MKKRKLKKRINESQIRENILLADKFHLEKMNSKQELELDKLREELAFCKRYPRDRQALVDQNEKLKAENEFLQSCVPSVEKAKERGLEIHLQKAEINGLKMQIGILNKEISSLTGMPGGLDGFVEWKKSLITEVDKLNEFKRMWLPVDDATRDFMTDRGDAICCSVSKTALEIIREAHKKFQDEKPKPETVRYESINGAAGCATNPGASDTKPPLDQEPPLYGGRFA